MTTLLELRTEARSLLNEASARVILDADLTRWANSAVKDFTSRVKQYERVVAQALVSNKSEYTLPTDILDLVMARYQDKYRLMLVDLSEWAASTYYNVSPTGIPSLISLSPHDRIMRLWTPPSSTSPTTTLTGAHNSSVTTLTVGSTTNFQTRGRVLIGSEQIFYEGKTATTLTNCRRGDGDTTAGTYVGGETVTEGTLVLTTKALPPTLVNDVDIVKFPVAYENAIGHFMAWKAEQKRSNHDRAKFHMEEYNRIRDEAAKQMFWDAQDGSPAVKDEEYGMGWYGVS